MRFILLGEFSGLHYALKLGLADLGHDVLLISDGDKRKSIAADIRLNSLFGFLPEGRINSLISSVCRLKIPFSDHLSIVSPLLLGGGRFVRELFSYALLLKAFDSVNTSSLCAAGSDSYWLRYVGKNLEYNPYDLKTDPRPVFSQFPANVLNEYAASKVDFIFGFTPDYFHAYHSIDSLSTKTFQLPMVGCSMTKSAPQGYSIIKNKVTILFGANKYDFKGGAFITKALQQFALNFHDVEIITPAMCSYNSWIEYVKRCDILIDQCRTYSYGVNALLGMALGKVVLTGWNWSTMDVFDHQQPPVIHISPSVKSVYNGLFQAYTLLKEGIHDPQSSGKFYDDYHSPKSIARKFIAKITHR